MIWLEILTSSLGLGLAAFTAWSAVRGTDWGVLIVIGTVPIQRAFMIGHGSAEITFTQACLIAFLAAAMLRFASGRLCIRLDLPTLLVLAMPLFMLMSVVANPGLRGWAGESYRWIGPALFFSIARSYVDFSTIRRLAMVLSSMAIGTTIWAVVQIVNERGPSSFQRNGLMRVYGGFGEPNPFAAFLVFVGLVLLGIVLSDQLRNYRLLCGIGALAAIGTALLTQSRGGLLGLIVGCAVLGLLWLPSLPRPLVVGSAIATSVVVAIGITGLVLLAPWSVRHEMVTVANWAERERTAHWAAAWEMLVAHPWFGIGAGAFSEQFRTFTTDWRFRISRGHAHNAYLQVAAEAGLLSLMVYLAAIAVLCRRLILVCSARAMAPVAAAMLAALSAVAVHGVFDYLNVLSLGLLFAGTLACAPGLTNKETRHA